MRRTLTVLTFAWVLWYWKSTGLWTGYWHPFAEFSDLQTCQTLLHSVVKDGGVFDDQTQKIRKATAADIRCLPMGVKP